MLLPVVQIPTAAISVAAVNPHHRFPVVFLLVIGGVISTHPNNAVPGHVFATVLVCDVSASYPAAELRPLASLSAWRVGAPLAVASLTPVIHADNAMEIDDPDYPMEDETPRGPVLHPDDPMDVDGDL